RACGIPPAETGGSFRSSLDSMRAQSFWNPATAAFSSSNDPESRELRSNILRLNTGGASHSWVTWLLLLRGPSDRDRVRNVSESDFSLNTGTHTERHRS